jgi:hypothetical protein
MKLESSSPCSQMSTTRACPETAEYNYPPPPQTLYLLRFHVYQGQPIGGFFSGFQTKTMCEFPAYKCKLHILPISSA